MESLSKLSARLLLRKRASPTTMLKSYRSGRSSDCHYKNSFNDARIPSATLNAAPVGMP
jgi:hypothetical protein